MPVTDQTVHLSRQAREALDKIVDQTTRDLVIAWANAWDEVSQAWRDAINDLIAYQQQNGAWPPAWRIARAERAQRALQATGEALAAVSAAAGVRIAETLTGLTADAAEWEARLIASQMPPQAVAGRMAVGATFNRVDPDALEAIVKRTTEQVTATTLPLSGEATAVMNRELVRGIAVGDNPRAAAARMLRRVEGGFNGGLARAMTIARTEMLDAHRAAAKAQRLANPDVVGGWQWLATLDTRTCPSCLALNGTRYPADQDGPNDHQNGRCTGVPVTKTWAELGFTGIDEPADTFPDARAWFDSLPKEDQRAVMGPGRLDLLNSGQVSWDDLTTTRTTPGWRDSHTPTTVRDLLASAA